MIRFGRAVAALLGGVALALAFPEPDVFPLAWIALIPLLVAAGATRARTGFGLGWLFGIGFFGTLLYWISIVGWVAWALLVLLEALFLGAFGAGWAAGSSRLPAGARVAFAAALWVALEYLRSVVPLGGFAWGQLAQSQGDAPWILALAGLGGSWAVAGLLVAVNALGAEAWRAWRERSLAGAGLAAGVAGLLLLVPVLLPGSSPDEGETLDVAIVQGASVIGRGEYWNV